MPRYIKKPIIIEAKQLTHTPESLEEICNWMSNVDYAVAVNDTHAILIPTLEGTMTANVGDWVIKGIKGEFYPCKPEIFEATYDLVDNSAASMDTV